MSDSLITLFSEILKIPAEKLNDNTSPANTREWDSLAAMHLIAAIEDTFQTRLTTKEIMNMSSIGFAREALIKKNIKLNATH